jgi:predicted transcriptional regulator
MKGSYRMKHILTLILMALLFTSGFSQSPDTTTSIAEPDLLNETDSPGASDELDQSNSDSSSYHLFMKLWDQKNLLQMNRPLSFSFHNPVYSIQPGHLPSGPEIFRRYGNLGFQSSTAYQYSYADELYRTHVLKPDYGNGVVVPILPMAFLALYGAREGFLALQKDPLISLEATDIKILEIIWGNPDITAVDCYELYNQNDSEVELTFLILQKRLDNLLNQKIIEASTHGDRNMYYNSRFTRDELLQRLEDELNKNAYAQHLARNMDIQRMKMLLLTRAAH